MNRMRAVFSGVIATPHLGTPIAESSGRSRMRVAWSNSLPVTTSSYADCQYLQVAGGVWAINFLEAFAITWVLSQETLFRRWTGVPGNPRRR